MTEDEHAPPSPVSSDLLKDYYDRGERAWAEYLRTGVAVLAEAVFARLDALIEKRRSTLLAGIAGDPNTVAEAPAVPDDLALRRDADADGDSEPSRRAGPNKVG